MNFNLLAIASIEMLEQMMLYVESPQFEIYSIISSAIFWLVGHIFLSIAIYHMTKKQGYKKLWLSFIPLVNLIPLGKLVGKTTVWGMKIKNVGFWACITTAVSFVSNILLEIGYYVYLFEYAFNVTVEVTNEFLYLWMIQDNIFWEAFNLISLAFDLAYIFFYVSLVFMVFRLYCPQRSFLFSILSVFIDPLFGIFLFVCRKNPKHVIVRVQPPQGGYYGGGYYGAPRNYNENAKNTNQKPENPFPEFDGESNDSNKNSNTDDDFFN